MQTLFNLFMLFQQIQFEIYPGRGIRVKVPRLIEVTFNDVCSDLSFLLIYNPYRNANVQKSR